MRFRTVSGFRYIYLRIHRDDRRNGCEPMGCMMQLQLPKQRGKQKPRIKLNSQIYLSILKNFNFN